MPSTSHWRHHHEGGSGMTPVLIVKAGDIYPTRWKVPVDLTGAAVRLVAQKDGYPAITLATTVTDAANGVVEHMLTGTLTVGDYRVEMEISRDGQIVTAPTDTYEN